MLEEKGALLVVYDDEKTTSDGLRHERKSKKATIAQLSIQVQILTRGNKALADGIDELHEKLAAAESKSKTDTEKWVFWKVFFAFLIFSSGRSLRGQESHQEEQS